LSEDPRPWPTVEAPDGERIADLTASAFELRRPSDILELVAAGVTRIVIRHDQLHPDFFDLSTGFAGELVQKCMNYGIRVAVVGGGNYQQRSLSFRHFAAETSHGTRFVFVDSVEAGVAKLGA
jgi:hypothetical protein